MTAAAWRHRLTVVLVGVALGIVLLPIVEPYRDLVSSDWTGSGSISHLWLTDPGHIYDRHAQRAVQAHTIGGASFMQPGQPDGLLPVVSPPWLALIGVPFVLLGDNLGGRAWNLAVLGALAAGLYCIARDRRPRRDAALAALPAFAGMPTALMVANGQSDGLLVLGLGLAWLAHRRGRSVLAGSALGLLLMKPQFSLALGAGLLAGRRFRIVGGLALAGLALVISSELHSPGIIAAWLRYAAANAGHIGADLGLPALAGSPWKYVLAAVAVVFSVALSARAGSDARSLAALVVGGLLSAPHVLATDLVLVGPALLLAGCTTWIDWTVLSLAALTTALIHQPIAAAVVGIVVITGFMVRVSGVLDQRLSRVAQ